MAELLAAERAFLKRNIADLAERYPGRYLLIKGEEVHGAFETYDAGIDAGVRAFGSGPFLVRSVADPEPETLMIPTLTVGVPLVSKPEHPH